MQVIRDACGGGNQLGAGDEFYERASRAGDPLYAAVEVLLKGPEVKLADYDLPKFTDPSGHARDHARLRWWRPGTLSLAELLDIREGALSDDNQPYPDLSDKKLNAVDHTYAYEADIPLVFGHHWRDWEPDEHIDWTEHTACVDFSAAKPDGHLVAYRWRGESTIDPAHYVNVQ